MKDRTVNLRPFSNKARYVKEQIIDGYEIFGIWNETVEISLI